MTIDDARLIELPRFNDPRGNLSFVEQHNQVPFKFERVYWIYDVPGAKTAADMPTTLPRNLS